MCIQKCYHLVRIDVFSCLTIIRIGNDAMQVVVPRKEINHYQHPLRNKDPVEIKNIEY